MSFLLVACDGSVPDAPVDAGRTDAPVNSASDGQADADAALPDGATGMDAGNAPIVAAADTWTWKQLQYPALVRTTAGNPFSAMNMVYIPYCTGDLHYGNTTSTLQVNGTPTPTYFWGAKDMDVFLARLVPTFSNVSRVISLGTSAGGFGSYLNFDRLAHAFGVRVDVIDDSGPPLTTQGQSDNSGLFSAWGVVPPAGCNACNSFLNIMKFDRQSQPQSRLGFLSLAEDTVISADFGYGLSAYGPEIESLFSANFGADPNVATYIVGGDPGHVVESQAALAAGYLPWMTALVSGSSAWTSEGVDGGM